jgi:hypothetical protein
MKIEFLDPAKKELLEAIAYYNEQSEGLGYRFAAEVRKTLSRIVQHPNAWTPGFLEIQGAVTISRRRDYLESVRRPGFRKYSKKVQSWSLDSGVGSWVGRFVMATRLV